MGKGVGATLTALVAIGLTCAPVHAQDRSRTIRQFQLTTWTAKDGAPPEIWALDQGPDGFLWLGTGLGLYRFDGIAFERYQPARGEQLASIDITAVKVLPSNEIWIGYSEGGVSRLKDGRVTSFTEKDGIWPGMVFQFRQDADGVLWAASRGGIARFQDGRWSRVDADWNLPTDFAVGFFVARDGVMWLGTARSIYFLRQGSRRFEPTGAVVSNATFTQTPDGRMWIGDELHGLRPLPDYVVGDHRNVWALRNGAPGTVLSVKSFAVDQEGVIWGTDVVNGGIFRFDPRQEKQPTHSLMSSDVDVFRREDGLTSDHSVPILSDREGNIWVGTNTGLNRFRRSEIVPEASVPPATPAHYSIAALPDATYITDGVWLYRARPHESARRLVRLPVRANTITSANTILLRRRDGALWYGNNGFMYRFLDNHVTRVALPDNVRDGIIHGIAEDGAGTLWVAIAQSGVYQLKDGAWTGRVDLGGLPTPVIAESDPAGPVWFGYTDSRVSRHDATRMRVYSVSDGLKVGTVECIAVLDGVVWVGGELGVARLENERFQTIGPDRVAPLFGVSGIGQAADGDVLFNGLMGIVRMDREEVRKAFADSSHAPAYDLYDRRNGLPGVAQQGWHAPTVMTGADGRIWFITNTGVSFLAGDHEQNPVPPHVAILSATVQGVAYSTAGALTLPEGTTSLTIAYTASALRTPERVRFRYRLEDLDPDWVDAGGRRTAAYSNLGPGRYQFHVIAANEDGVWNEEGATLALEIPPTFLQSWAFKVLVGVTLLALLWLAYAQRIRAAERGARRAIKARYEAALSERTRIAQELHDTLLQGFTGITFKLRAIQLRLLERPNESRADLEDVLAQAETALTDARHMIWDMRSAELEGRDLADAFEAAARQAMAESSVGLVFKVSGERRRLPLEVETAAIRMGREAVVNALKHAAAGTLEAHIEYGPHSLLLKVIDDGRGIAAGSVESATARGHWGIAGMKARAERAGGTLEIASVPGRGTTVSISLPTAPMR